MAIQGSSNPIYGQQITGVQRKPNAVRTNTTTSSTTESRDEFGGTAKENSGWDYSAFSSDRPSSQNTGEKQTPPAPAGSSANAAIINQTSVMSMRVSEGFNNIQVEAEETLMAANPELGSVGAVVDNEPVTDLIAVHESQMAGELAQAAEEAQGMGAAGQSYFESRAKSIVATHTNVIRGQITARTQRKMETALDAHKAEEARKLAVTEMASSEARTEESKMQEKLTLEKFLEGQENLSTRLA